MTGKPRVVAIIQARMGSSRLPGKSLRSLGRVPIIEHVLTRARLIPGVDDVVLATSCSTRDFPLSQFVANQLGVKVVHGAEADVLDRYAQAADETRADVIMRLTGDCPFLAPEVAGDVLQHFFEGPLSVPFFSNDTTFSGFPDGTDVEVFQRTVLTMAHRQATAKEDREHVTRWMRREVATGTLKSDTDWSRFKLSIDTEADYSYAAAVMARLLAHQSFDYSLAATVRAAEEVACGG